MQVRCEVLVEGFVGWVGGWIRMQDGDAGPVGVSCQLTNQAMWLASQSRKAQLTIGLLGRVLL